MFCSMLGNDFPDAPIVEFQFQRWAIYSCFLVLVSFGFSCLNDACADENAIKSSSIRFGVGPGSRRIGFEATNELQLVIPDLDPLGKRVLAQANNLTLVGGVLMVSTAQPDTSLKSTTMRLSYDASREDGERVTLVVDEKRGSLDVYDWELLPIAKFVDSGHHGAVSIRKYRDHEKIATDRAFVDSLLALRLIQADLMGRGDLVTQAFLPSIDPGVLLGPGEAEKMGSANEIKNLERSLESVMDAARDESMPSVLTDANVVHVFSIEEDRLVVTGEPYYFYWQADTKGKEVLPHVTLNAALKKAWPRMRLANPVVIESMKRTFKTVSFFRFMKQESPDNWRKFVKQLEQNFKPPQRIPTPSILSVIP